MAQNRDKRGEMGAQDDLDEHTVFINRCAKTGFSDNKAPKVKICATGELTKKLTVKGVPCSAAAKAKIEAAGGTVA